MKYESIIIHNFKELENEDVRLHFYVEDESSHKLMGRTVIFPNKFVKIYFSNYMGEKKKGFVLDVDVDESVTPYVVKDFIVNGVSKAVLRSKILEDIAESKRLRKELNIK